ncbi:hypothetical protein [Streptomyces atratus]|uniref:hypothetical protein n=1 Tax=Streptomyces atratus TaxID=1893 RepID=UPI001E632194|nr:hypothetical protein [Streptomyces atratus]
MSCVPHRGGTGKRLFLLDHFITVAGGSGIDAGKVNARDRVLERAHRCEQQRGSPVNFVAVDCTTTGDVRGAVDALNAERPARRPTITERCGAPRPGRPRGAAIRVVTAVRGTGSGRRSGQSRPSWWLRPS